MPPSYLVTQHMKLNKGLLLSFRVVRANVRKDLPSSCVNVKCGTVPRPQICAFGV